MTEKSVSMDDIVSLCKRRGFLYPGSEIYGGLAGTWDYGPMGVALKNNIKDLWWKMFVDMRDDMYGIDAAILMHPKVWEASGHVSGFSDPLVECTKCKRRFRADHLEDKKKCSVCEGALGAARQFNMMFKTQIGAMEDSSSISYLRPETAGGMFTNYKNIIDSFHPDLPFGLAQIGKAFRNEIAPRDFVFRSREFEQMEIEWFIRPETWEEWFEYWRGMVWAWFLSIGLSEKNLKPVEIPKAELAFYSKRTMDFYFDFPSLGFDEITGLAYRTDYDLSRHQETSGVNLTYFDQEKNERFLPHIIEPSFGFDRILLAVLCNAYHEEGEEDDNRIVMKFAPRIAPVKAAVFPLLKNKPELVNKAREIYGNLKLSVPQVMWDDNGNIGKRYRRQDEIGTPYCITVDFDTLENDTVTVRDRDTMKQERMLAKDLIAFIKGKIS